MRHSAVSRYHRLSGRMSAEFNVGRRKNMAFLICFSRSEPHDHVAQKAIYLDQQFYELIFHHCTKKRSYYANLSVIASLRYKSPLVVVEGKNLESLVKELEALEQLGHAHPQLAKFREVCGNAISQSCSLSISGDMYPEL
jgi:hypothetical protein